MTVVSENFTVEYYQATDEAQARAVSGYMENAYKTIVLEMGLKRPGRTTRPGYNKTWPVFFVEQEDAYARADDGYYIEVQPGTAIGDDLSHTCHHEFTHFVQYKTLKDAGNMHNDGMSWFDETMADAVGFYAQNGLGTMYSAADTYMGDFDMRLDSDEYSITNNDDYEYVHFPFISFILGSPEYGRVKFKAFFETFYSYTPGKHKINMVNIDNAAATALGKTISGRDGIYWEFFRDYFVSGQLFNMDKFKNLPNRPSGTPFELTNENSSDQGATILEISSAASSQPREFNMLRLSGQLAVFRYTGTSEASLTLSIAVRAMQGEADGRAQLVAFKRVGGVLRQVGIPDDLNNGVQTTKNYSGFGRDIHEIYLVMANTSSQFDGYKVTAGFTAVQ